MNLHHFQIFLVHVGEPLQNPNPIPLQVVLSLEHEYLESKIKYS
jgi:hypothetical protein